MLILQLKSQNLQFEVGFKIAMQVPLLLATAQLLLDAKGPCTHTDLKPVCNIPLVVYTEQLELAHVPAPAKNRSAVENCHCASPTSAAAGGPSDTCKPTGACTHTDRFRSRGEIIK
ncbi:hypothetical protein AVEN_162383-1 [Araneus ventricosus]|uniref:Uncharacterized protein n=1 Tax=Araneus ventricosus TaxID=182803 RepID=A0A4Y2GLC6_ARAVE|nr:hypothetical protein AVEN_162383-1 [Araneus ventricosus]